MLSRLCVRRDLSLDMRRYHARHSLGVLYELYSEGDRTTSTPLPKDLFILKVRFWTSTYSTLVIFLATLTSSNPMFFS